MKCVRWLQVWFQNRRAKFRKQERLTQSKVDGSASGGGGGGGGGAGGGGVGAGEGAGAASKDGSSPVDVKDNRSSLSSSPRDVDIKPQLGKSPPSTKESIQSNLPRCCLEYRLNLDQI